MNFKIVETNNTNPDILIYRCPDSFQNGDYICRIITYGDIDNNDDTSVAIEAITFDTEQSMQDFIKYYSKEQANNFCETHQITYL